MASYILTWNPKITPWEEGLVDPYKEIKRGRRAPTDWSIRVNVKRVRKGDRFYFLRQEIQPRGVIGSGYLRGRPKEDDEWGYLVDIEFDVLRDAATEPILSIEALKRSAVASQNWQPRRSGEVIREELEDDLERIWSDFLRRPESVEESREAVERALKHGGQGFGLTKEERKAIEKHAMDRATETLEKQGYQVDDVSAHSPYDLCCRQKGKITLYVEVKGTKELPQRIFLTSGEVRFAQANRAQVMLMVVHSITVKRQGRKRQASGGIIKKIFPWHIRQASLSPMQYEYRLPPKD